VEAEVVKLALAIAKQVLHREVKLDPLLLAGVVKVALGKVAEDSATTLRVPVADLEKWRESLASMQDNSLHLLGDEKLGPGECLLDTNVGRVELGVSAQLQEIERGFFDLLQQRPA
jgi:flagellar assembly protein FliH